MKQEKIFPVSVRALNPKEMHAYAIQLTYSDGSIRNYYLKNFRTYEIPEEFDIDGYLFNRHILSGVQLQPNGDVLFPNHYQIPCQNCRYDSFPQLQVQNTKRDCIYEDKHCRLESFYQIPFTSGGRSSKLPGMLPQWGFYPERHLPELHWLGIDEDGIRRKDIALCELKRSTCFPDTSLVRTEPEKLYGYLRDDGSWLIPPVYDEIRENLHGLVIGTRRIRGEKVLFRISEDGTPQMTTLPDFVGNFRNGLAPFNVAGTDILWDSPLLPEYYTGQMETSVPGRWGFLDLNGNIILEPRYLYAIGFQYEDGEYSAVACEKDGQAFWGVINQAGHEVIPCRYACTFVLSNSTIVFQEIPGGFYGLMTPDGNCILSADFCDITDYDEEHMLAVVSYDGELYGVYSAAAGELRIPAMYDSIYFRASGIYAQTVDGKSVLFNYEGNPLIQGKYDQLEEAYGRIFFQKNEKFGVLRPDGSMEIPPVLAGCEERHVQFYQKGYLITGTYGAYGVSRTNGEVVLPEHYRMIYLYDGFIIAEDGCTDNQNPHDILFRMDGQPILAGSYDHMAIDEEHHLLTCCTPDEFLAFRLTRR